MQTVRTFEGLLNADDAPEAIAPNEFINGCNFRFGGHIAGKSQRMEVIESNRQIVNTLLSGTHSLLGVFEDNPKDRVFYFTIDDSGKSFVWCFFQKTESILLVLKDDNMEAGRGLGFSADRYIHSISMIGDLMYWVDFPYAQRRINVEAALKGNNPTYSTATAAYTFPLEYTATTIARRPPNLVPTVAKVKDTAILVNQIKDDGFKFAYRYVYRDGEESTFSAWSLLAPPNTKDDTEVQKLNAIDVKIPLAEKVPQDVRVIELAVVYASDNSMFVVKRWDKYNDTQAAEIVNHNSGGSQLAFRFANTDVGTSIGQAVKTKLFDSVPVTSAALEIARDRLFLGRNTLGYDTPVKSSLLVNETAIPGTDYTSIFEYTPNSLVYETADGPEEIIPLLPRNGTWPDFTADGTNTGFTYTGANAFTNAKISFNLIATFTKNTAIPFTLKVKKYVGGVWTDWTQTTFAPFAVPYPTTQNIVATIESLSINTNDKIGFFITMIPDFGRTWSISFSTGSSGFYVYKNAVTGVSGYQVLKSDAPYKVGIVFYDEFMRQCGVLAPSAAAFRTPDRVYSSGSDYNYIYQWQLSNANAINEIPEWARYYSIVMSKCLRTDFFLQSRASDISYCTYNATTGEYDGLGTDNTWSTSKAGVAVKADLLFNYRLGYSLQKGDVIKIYIGTEVRYTPIKAVQGEWIIVEPVDCGVLTSAAALFEIYTPKLNADSFFYEVGGVYGINNPGTGTRTYGTLSGQIQPDVYLLNRSDGGSNYYVEAMNPNDTIWRQWLTSHGRVQVVDTVGQQYIENGVSYSNKWIRGTTLNGLSSFEALNSEVLPMELAGIQKLILTSKIQGEGTVMLAIGADDTVSIYIEEAMWYEANGVSSIIKSDKVIGQVNPLRGGYGTRHPESVKAWQGLVFWYDSARGYVINYSVQGLVPVSNNKTRRFWKRYSDAYNKKDAAWWTETQQRPFIVAGIDTWNGEYLISLPRVENYNYPYASKWDVYDGQAKTMVYAIPADKWGAPYGYVADSFSMLNNVLYSLKEGSLWCHDVVTNQMSFYNDQQNACVMVAESAGAFQVTKSWLTLTVVGNQEPEKVEAETFLPYNQMTVLDGADFKNTEGKYYADWRRNINTGGLTPQQAIFKGERMRGQTMYVMLEYAGDTKVGERIYINSLHFNVNLSTGHTV